MRLCISLLLLVLSLSMLVQSSLASVTRTTKMVVQDSSSWDDTVFTISPDSNKCYPNLKTITVEVTSYLAGTKTVDKALDGVPFYLRWSDLPAADHGNAYIVNADNPSESTQSAEHITTTVKKGVATFHFYVVNGDDKHTYEVMSSDMADPKMCHEVYSCSFKICPSGAFGDPQFTGLQGQQYQVHGRPDTLFNLISYQAKGFAVNSEFVYLAEGKCDYNNTVCWSHPGTYFGKVGILLDNSVRVLVNSGAHKQGLTVYINDKRQKPSDNALVIGNNIIHVQDYDRVEIRTPDFFITLVNSDMFLNMDVSLLEKELLAQGRKSSFQAPKDAPNGLLGQTWQLKEYVSATGVKRPYKGTTDDYIVDTPFEFMH